LSDCCTRVARGDRCPRRRRAARRNAGQLQHALDGFTQAARLALDGLAVLAHALRIADDAVGEVAGGRANHRHRRAQLVRHRRDELPSAASASSCERRADTAIQPDHHRQQQQDARADDEIAGPDPGDGGLERS
jgi:hypothetical protein